MRTFNIDKVDTTRMEQLDTNLGSLLGPKLFNDLTRTFFKIKVYCRSVRRKFFHVKEEDCEEYLKQNMRFSCVVVEINRKCAGSLFHPSTCKPVSVKETRIRGPRGVEGV